ncbi:hypothetical protein COJ56_00255 [Bacillus thuringiensis]|nr:hypothetical protein COJ56_00255 [Bacillus thuringiensis]
MYLSFECIVFRESKRAITPNPMAGIMALTRYKKKTQRKTCLRMKGKQALTMNRINALSYKYNLKIKDAF